MKAGKKKFALLLTLSSLSVASVVMIATLGEKDAFQTRGAGHISSCVWNHYSEVTPTFEEDGIREYWVCCSHQEHVFTKPTIGSIVEKSGKPSTNEFSQNDDRILPAYSKCVDFENAATPFSVIDSTISGSATNTNKNYKIKDISLGNYGVNGSKGIRTQFTAGTDSGVVFRKEYVDSVFSDSSIQAIEFDFKADAESTNCRHRTAGSNITHFSGSNGSGFATFWQKVAYTRAMYESDKGSGAKSYYFMWGTTAGDGYVYFDNFKPVTLVRKDYETISRLTFEECFYPISTSGTDVFVKDAYTATNIVKVNTNLANNIDLAELSTFAKSEGTSSLHFHKKADSTFYFYLKQEICDASESHGGIKFDIMTTSYVGPANFTVYTNRTSTGKNGPATLNVGKWVTVTVPFNDMRDTNNGYDGLFAISGTDGKKEMDIYVDNIRFADADDYSAITNSFEDAGVYKIENTNATGQYYFETGLNYTNGSDVYPIGKANLRDFDLSYFWLNGTTAVSGASIDNKHTTHGSSALKLDITNKGATYFFFNKKINSSLLKGDAIEFDIYSECNETFTFGTAPTAGRTGGFSVEPNKWTTISLIKGDDIKGVDQFFRLHEGPLAVGSIWIDNIRFVRSSDSRKILTFEKGTTSVGDNLVTYTPENSSNVILKASGHVSNIELSNDVDFGTGKVLKVTKDNQYTAFYLGSEFYSQIGDNDKFSFDLMSTISTNSTTNVKNFQDGMNNYFGDGTYAHPANTKVTYVFDKSKITSDGRFLQVQGSSAGAYYFDNFKIIHQENKAVNAGTFFKSPGEGFELDLGRQLSENTVIYLDGEVLQKYGYSINGTKIKFASKAVPNGEHIISYNLQSKNYELSKESYYFGLYEAKSTTSDSKALTYGSQGYQTFSGFENASRVVFEGKSIAFEKSGTSIMIPDAALVECLETVNGAKVSQNIKLIVLCGDNNSTVKELSINITLSGDATEKTKRSYTSDEYYHTFGYSSTAGGTGDQSLLDEDYFMEYDRSGLDCVYEQITSIGAGEITPESFKQGGANYRIGLDLDECDKLGKECYIVDNYIRGIIQYDQVAVYKASSFKGYVTYMKTIDSDSSSQTAFKNFAKEQLGLSNTLSLSWERYQKPAYGTDGYYADFETFVQGIYNRLSCYANHPSLKKIVICDEPRYYNLECVGQLYKATKEALRRFGREDIEVDSNLLPLSAGWGYDDGDGLGPAVNKSKVDGTNYPSRVATYQQYLTKFITETGADYISYDLYPLWDGVLDECAYSNLIVAAEFAKANNINLNVVTETYTAVTRNSNTNRRVMSRDDMHWLCNMLMGFGVDRVSFFTYYNRAGSSSEFRYDQNDKNATVGCMKIEYFDTTTGEFLYSEKTPVWYNVQTMLDEMNEFSDVSLNFNYVTSNLVKGSTITNTQPNAVTWAEQVDSDSFSNGPLTGVSVDKEYTLTSTLVDNDGNYMYMIQNTCDPKYESLQTVTLTFSGSSYVVIYENGSPRVVNLTSNKLTLKLSSGNAAFVMPY